MPVLRICVLSAILAASGLTLIACESLETLPPAPIRLSEDPSTTPSYRIGADDSLQIFVWRNPDLSQGVQVRPDGRISIPLIEDLPATGKTPTQLARDIEKELAVFIQDPIVTVIVRGFVGPHQDRVRVIGEAAQPQALPYRDTLTLLDVLIAVGGLTDFAAGNRATVTRLDGDLRKQFRVRLDDLLRSGDMSANVQMKPGDILVIPEAWF